MELSARGLDLLKELEGYRDHAYLDSVGVATIGYGTTHGVQLGQTCTEDQATEWLRRDTFVAASTVNQAVKVPITQNQFDALVLLGYNIGVHSLAGSTLLKLLNAGDVAGAAAQFLRWDQARGRTLAGLQKRRGLEQALFCEA